MIQIFGTRKCSDTRKAQRFFKERGIKTQFIDLTEKEVSRGELNSILRSVSLEDLIDKEGREYERRNLKYLQHNIEQELLDYPLLFKTPIVRLGQQAAVGHRPDLWKEWANSLKK